MEGMVPERHEQMSWEQKIDLPYTYTAGPLHREALLGLADRRLVGAHAPGDRLAYVPARPFAPDGRRLTETVEMEAAGALEALTVAHHLVGDPVYGLIRIDGAANLLLHRLGEGAEDLDEGSRVRAVWRAEREGRITDIEHFAPE